MTKQNIVLIGAGKRVLNTIIPAILCTKNKFNISHIIGTHSKKITIGNHFEINTSTSLKDVPIKKVDILFIAVPPDTVHKVLKSLSIVDTSHIILFIDTPVCLPQTIGILRYQKKYKHCFTTEDFIGLLPYKIAKETIKKNNLGPILEIEFVHYGFKYHALATIKYLTNKTYFNCKQNTYPTKLLYYRRKHTIFRYKRHLNKQLFQSSEPS